MAGKRQRNRNRDRDYDEQIIRWITTVFLIYMFVFYPLFMGNKYFHITNTKYLLFKVGVIVYSIILILAVLLGYLNRLTYQSGVIRAGDKPENGSKRSFLMAQDICMILFFISGFMAWLMAEDKNSAFTGADGRRCGLQFMIISFIMYTCLSYGYKINCFIMPVFSIVSIVTYIIAILQHLEFNPFKLLDGVSLAQRDLFVSTFGNINTFASFVCISMAFSAGMFIFEKNKAVQLIYGTAVFVSGGALIAANSDSVYAGCIMVMVVMLFAAIAGDRMMQYAGMLFLIINGYVAMSLTLRLSNRGVSKISGFSKVSEHIGLMLIIDFIAAVIFMIFVLKKRQKKTAGKAFSIKKQMIIAAAALIAVIVIVIAVGIRQRWNIFVFDDSWGTNRGYIWKRLITLYHDFPIKNKLFGNGNESVKALMISNYYDEMMEITGVVYDNAHNEYLQYLVTLGIFGVLSYAALIITTVLVCIKYGRYQPVLYACVTVVLAYCAQAAFNLNQSITTPYVFLFIGLTAGVVRMVKMQRETSRQ